MKIIFRCDPALLEILPRPIPAKQTLPEWLRSMPRKAYSDLHEREIRTVKQCPPFVDAMGHGFMVLLPCDVHVNRGIFTWDWDLPPLTVDEHPSSPLSFHVPAQLTGTPFHDANSSAIKFNSFWTIELEEGWSLFATHPVNRQELPFMTLTGLISSRTLGSIFQRFGYNLHLRACCLRALRWHNVFLCRASNQHLFMKVSRRSAPANTQSWLKR